MQKTPTRRKIHCNWCGLTTNHNILEHHDSNPVNGEILSLEILQCAGCDTFCFYQERLRGDVRIDWIAYPTPRNHQPKDIPSLPSEIASVYENTVDAYNYRLYLMAAMGIRALIEAVCKERGVKSGRTKNGTGANLEGKINGLVDAGYLTQNQADALHQNRYMGNDAAHDLEIPEEKAVLEGLRILEHMLEAIFDLPNSVGTIASARNARK